MLTPALLPRRRQDRPVPVQCASTGPGALSAPSSRTDALDSALTQHVERIPATSAPPPPAPASGPAYSPSYNQPVRTPVLALFPTTADWSILQPPNQWTPPPPPSAAGPPSYAYQQPQFYGSGPPPPAFGEKASYAPPPPPPQHQPPPPQQIVVQQQQPPTPTEEEKKKGRLGRFGKQMGGHVAQGAGFGFGAGLAVRAFSLRSCSLVCASCGGSSICRT